MLIRQAENTKRPLHSEFQGWYSQSTLSAGKFTHRRLTPHQDLTKNRIKRQSTNHLSKRIQRQHADAIPYQSEQLEMLQDYEDWMDEDLNIALDLPGVRNKGDAQLKALALVMNVFCNDAVCFVMMLIAS